MYRTSTSEKIIIEVNKHDFGIKFSFSFEHYEISHIFNKGGWPWLKSVGGSYVKSRREFESDSWCNRFFSIIAKDGNHTYPASTDMRCPCPLNTLLIVLFWNRTSPAEIPPEQCSLHSWFHYWIWLCHLSWCPLHLFTPKNALYAAYTCLFSQYPLFGMPLICMGSNGILFSCTET